MSEQQNQVGNEGRLHFNNLFVTVGVEASDNLVRLTDSLKPFIGGTENEHQLELCKRLYLMDQAIYLAYQLPFDPRGKGLVTQLTDYEFGMGCKAVGASQLFVKVTRSTMHRHFRIFGDAACSPRDSLIATFTFETEPTLPNQQDTTIIGWSATMIFQQRPPVVTSLHPEGLRVSLSISEDNKEMVYADHLAEALSVKDLTAEIVDTLGMSNAPSAELLRMPLQNSEYFNKQASGKEANTQEQVMQEAQNNSNEQAAAPVPGVDHPTEFSAEGGKEQEGEWKLVKRQGQRPSQGQYFPYTSYALRYLLSWLKEGEEGTVRTVLDALWRFRTVLSTEPDLDAMTKELIETGNILKTGLRGAIPSILFVKKVKDEGGLAGARKPEVLTLRFFDPTASDDIAVDILLKIDEEENLQVIRVERRDPTVAIFTRAMLSTTISSMGPVYLSPQKLMVILKEKVLCDGAWEETLPELEARIQAMRELVQARPGPKGNITASLEPILSQSPVTMGAERGMRGNTTGFRVMIGVSQMSGMAAGDAPRIILQFNISGDSDPFEVKNLIYQQEGSQTWNMLGFTYPQPQMRSDRRPHMRPWRNNQGAAWSANPAERIAQQSGEGFVGQNHTGMWGKGYGERGGRDRYQPNPSFQGRPWYDLTEEQQAQRKHIKPRNVYLKTDSFEMLRLFIAGACTAGAAEQEELRLFESRLVDLDLKLRQFDRPVIYEARLHLDGSPIAEAIDPSARLLITVSSDDKQLTMFEGHLRS